VSGAGRGTPRISPLQDAYPTGTGVIPIGNGLWCFSSTPPSNAQALTGTFTLYSDGTPVTPVSSFVFPKGGVRGLLALVYTPGAIGSQLEVEVLYDALKIYSIPGTTVSPAGGDEQGSEIPISQPVYQTLVTSDTNPVTFGIPICIPAGCPTALSLLVREVGTIGGTINFTRFTVENFGC